ncbi:bifunctional 2-polyprenyl-6-hydroxyphenol methylase/3-demethylubiquinol 3-O-methyltransferase UbiG [Emticicia sp. 21SJ11W-3]|uniref:class I SAM-dependent methyltransferase n=1 Tax=Emticicia sp. 21SJ11W-3 TaxID=2916755 RepID=UPI0020A11D33|nr:class I SAM-dependent methyltransferase [Emticicia sp. 21SJ11W-3]UTA66235.1 class I SAM-dependent methyltransferase [Emticicia sp. 21SJ11W-3]
MLSSRQEYQIMYEAEGQLWWYKILHEKILNTISSKFADNKKIKILDAGCGTGGLMQLLIKHGYVNIEGFDFSDDAVDFCKERKLNVQKIDLTDFNTEFADASFDVIINDDVLYQFEDEVIVKAIKNMERKLKPEGILISNNNAFQIFYGTHDKAVGGVKRFTKSDFEKYLLPTNLKIIHHTYWSLLLSPLILGVRLLQQFQLKFNLIDRTDIKSDVSVPGNFLNNALYKIVKLEEQLFRRGIFGSSLFLIMVKK